MFWKADSWAFEQLSRCLVQHSVSWVTLWAWAWSRIISDTPSTPVEDLVFWKHLKTPPFKASKGEVGPASFQWRMLLMTSLEEVWGVLTETYQWYMLKLHCFGYTVSLLSHKFLLKISKNMSRCTDCEYFFHWQHPCMVSSPLVFSLMLFRWGLLETLW